MSKTLAKKPDARQRILETAERLFYAEGIRAVGIDRIIAEAGVAKMTLYNHFASKDDLILAVLQLREQQVDAMFTKSIERHARNGSDRLNGFFTALQEWFDSRGFRGCSFINAAVELADSNHPASQFSTAHKGRFHDMLADIILETAGKKAAKAAPAVALLVEGAIVTAVLEKSSDAAEVARQASLALVSKAKRS